MLLTIIAFIIILTVLVLVHELGHFMVAKFFKIKVEEFGFGFPPRVFGKKIGETIYSINLLPVGGFVKLYGEDDAGGGSVKSKSKDSKEEKADIKRAFFARPLWQRMSVVVAGVVMNFILAVVLISVLFATIGAPVPTDRVLISEVQSGSPAQAAGLRVDDEIVAVDGEKIENPQGFIESIDENLGEEVALSVVRDNEELTLELVPRENPPEGQGAIGIMFSPLKKYSWIEAPYFGTLQALSVTQQIVVALGDLVADLVTTGEAPEGVAGPVGVAQLTGTVVGIGASATIWFVALLSLNLAILNILPIPALDGGRFFFQIIELVTRKKVSPKYEGYAHAAGLIVLLSLIALITIFDIGRLIAGESLIPDM